MIDPTNPIGIVVRLMLLLFAMTVGITTRVTQPVQPPVGSNPPPPPSVGDTFRSYTLINSVETQVMESNPFQVTLVVHGQQADGCELPVVVDQQREGNTIYVDIYREMNPSMICTMQVVPYDATIPLADRLEAGQYTINVNGTIIDLKL